MTIPVLIEPVANKRFRARAGEPLGLTAEGATKDEALENLRVQVTQRLQSGSDLVTLDVPGAEPNPWVQYAGMFKDDPLIDDWKNSMAEYRQTAEEDPNYL